MNGTQSKPPLTRLRGGRGGGMEEGKEVVPYVLAQISQNISCHGLVCSSMFAC